MKKQGILFLIPTFLSENTADKYLTGELLQVLNHTKTYVVENEKTARKFLKEAGIKIPQSELVLYPYGKHQQETQLSEVFKILENGENVGLMSEAGCPAIADPGAEVVKLAHQKGITVHPLIGASSILLALMSSGFNGQSFSFWGYLPIDKADRKRKIKDLELLSEKFHQTQIFIETPFRNQALLDDLLNHCSLNTQLCVAYNLTSSTEFIKSATILEWKKIKMDFQKEPCIFLIYRG